MKQKQYANMIPEVTRDARGHSGVFAEGEKKEK
jgi:hypothetical protein